jgi:hypothetical protein
MCFGSHPFQVIVNSLNLIPNFEEIAENPLSCCPLQTVFQQLKNVRPKHLEVDENYFQTARYSQCMLVYGCKEFELASFLLPKGTVIPLHDHPDMTVLSKVLKGCIRIRSFSAVVRSRQGCNDSEAEKNDEDILVRLEFQAEKFETDDPWYLTPSHGNYHEITALSDCILFDVLFPPYNDEDDVPFDDTDSESKSGTYGSHDHRECTFYNATPSSPASVSHHAFKNNHEKEKFWKLSKISASDLVHVALPTPITYRGYRPSV